MRYYATFILMIIVLHVSGQEDWTSWDANYTEKNYADLIRSESVYRDKVEGDSGVVPYYVRFNKYRFKGKYLNKDREIKDSVVQSMERVYGLAGFGNMPYSVKHEYLFEIEGNEVWLPIQEQLEETLKTEKKMRMKKESTLYCAFFNEHSNDKKLYNTLLICAFK